MNIERLEQHIKEHPADYQSVIALYKQKSKEIEKQRRKREIEMLRKVAECRRKYNEEREQLGLNREEVWEMDGNLKDKKI